jgi:hypothetical protein
MQKNVDIPKKFGTIASGIALSPAMVL